jgi:hypothetical protein
LAESIRYTQTVQITDGPSLSKTALLSSEAYDVISATIEKSTGPTTINIQPGGTGDAVLLFITSDLYEDLTYTVDAEITEIVLDKPQLFLGGQLDLLGATCNALKFTNASATTDANVRIIVARSAE